MMKLILDLGTRRVDGRKFRKRFGIYECSICKKHFEARTEVVKIRNQENCNSCASKYKRAKIKHNMRYHRLNNTINNMIQRCENKKTKYYRYYGLAGIKVCDEWRHNRDAFYTWAIKNGYNDSLTIDRINGSKGYSPDNCRWVTQSIQSQNTRYLSVRNKTGYRGVSFDIVRNKYASNIRVNNKQIHLGYYTTAVQASEAYIRYVYDHKTQHNYKPYDIG